MLNPRRVLLDTNLLILWIIGSVAPHKVGTQRTASYTLEDFYLLRDHLQNYQDFLITPGVATEVSNLIGFEGKYLDAARALLQSQLQVWEEVYHPSSELSRIPAFSWAGLTDVGIRSAARQAIEVLTDDGRLSAWLLREGVQVMNFNHLRFPRP